MPTYQQNIDFIASLSFDPQSMKAIDDVLGKTFTESVKRATAIGGARITKAFVEGAEKAAAEMEEAAEKIAGMEARIAAEMDDTNKAALRRQYADDLKHYKKQLYGRKRAAELETKAHDKYLSRQEEMLKAYDDLVVNMKVDKAQLAKDMGEALSGAFGKLNSGDLSGLVGSLGGALSKGGGMLEAAGLAAGGAEAGGLAAAAASLGPVVAALGATVGVVAAVGAVFQMAYDQTKKYNQALVEGAGAADFFSTGAGDMAASLNEMRDAVFELGTRFRMDTEEIAKFTNALNTSGVTYKEFGALAGRAANDQQAFMDVTRTAIVASKALGIEASDAAGFMDRSMRDLGKTTLPEIQSAFSMIGDAAARSGMTVKSFFTAVNEATSGMALHNIRLEDTIGLMGTMADVLGEDLAKERAKLEGQFKGMGYTERIKTIMTTGTGTTSKIVGADARAQARALGEPLKTAITELGGDLGKSLMEGGELSVDKLGRMTEDQYRKLVVMLRASGDDQAKAAARQLDNMRDLARGATRPGDVLAQADAVGQLSKSGELAMQLASASAVLGEKGISSMQGLTRAAFEQISGMSGENFEIMKRLDRELRGQFDALQERIKTGSATEEEQKFQGMDFTEAVAAGFGGKEFEAGVRGGFSTMEKMTEQMLTETQSVTTTLKNYIGFILENIYSSVDYIARIMGGSSQADVLEARSSMVKELERVARESSAVASEVNDLVRKEAAMGLSDDEKNRLETARQKYADLGVEKAGLQAGMESLSQSGLDPKAAMALAELSRTKAAFQASGSAEDAAKYRAAKAASQMATPSLAVNAARGAALSGNIGSGALMGAAYHYLSGDSEAAEQISGELAAMSEEDRTYFTKNGKPIAKLAAEQKTLLDKLLQQMKDTEKSRALSTLAGTGEGGAAAVAAYLQSGDVKALSEGFASPTDPNVTMALETLGVTQTPKAEDFIYRGGASGGVITPINTADQFLGMKPGGPVDRAARGGGGTVVININGDTATIVRTVKDVLQKSGLTASPNNGFA